MSGDVQPRKRKDKRRKKEGGSLGNIYEPVSSNKFKRSESGDKKVFDLPDQGEKIHVQNEHGVGGNICVKIIFFCLFGLLVGAVGLIYMKSLGSTDVDLPTIEESRFAEYFTGWLDDSTDDHEHEALESIVDHEEHEEQDEHEESDEHDEHDTHGGHDDHEEEENENEEDQNSVQDSIFKLFGLQGDEPEVVEECNMEVNKDTESEESGVRQDVDENEESMEEEDEEHEEEEENDVKYEEGEEEEEENDMEDEEGDNGSEVDGKEQKNDENEGYSDDENEDDLSQVDEEDDDKYGTSELDEDEDEESGKDENINEEMEDDNEFEKKLYMEKQKEDYNNNKDDDYDINAKDNIKEEEEDEEKENSEENGNFNSKIENDEFGYEEIDISDEDLEEEIDDKLNINQDEEETEDQSKKVTSKMLFKENKKESIEQIESSIEEDDQETEEMDFGGVAVKLGVGIALIIVAHLVLVKKWKSMRNAPSDENTSAETEEKKTEKKEVENLYWTDDSIISRRQTLLPENICFHNEAENEGLENDEEKNIEEDEEYSEEEVEEEKFKRSKNNVWETFEKPSWSIKKNENEGDEKLNNEELEDEEDNEEEEFEEEDVEEINDEQEEEEVEDAEEEEDEDENEDDDDDDDEEEEEEEEEEDEDYEEDADENEMNDKNDSVKQKLQNIGDDEKQEEPKMTLTPPPRTKTGRGAQEIDEDFVRHFEEENEIKETNRDKPTAEEINNNSGSEEQRTPEKKVGNEDEWAFRQELDFADEQLENNPKAAVKVYDEIISKKPTIIRALIGRARALDRWAEKEKSNFYLNQAINAYKTLLINYDHLLDDEVYVKMAERCIERMRFAGALASAIDIHKALIAKYPNIPKYRNTLAVTYLMLNKIPQARVLLNETLRLWPGDGFALVHYGFILKTSDNNMEEGAKKLMAGIQTREEGVIDGMFFFHLGDALNRLGRGEEAMKWYELGVKEGLFLSKYQRSLYNVNRLKGQPWWTKEETTYQDFFKKLEDNWLEIRREGLELLHSKGVNLFKEEAENLKESGDWKQLDLYFRGRKQASCNKAPITCSVISSFKPASTCTRGQIKFSVMLPKTHVWPHCGPTNCRLRSHLGLVVPKKTFIRVADETRSWEEGKVIIFDDSFEHEVWHNGTGLRLVLIVDVWHPELTNHERKYLSPI